MSDQEGFQELAEELRNLVKKLDAPKKRDIWDKLPAVTTFASTVIIAALGLFLTQSYQRQEALRQKDFRDAQIRIEQMKAITALAPLLASADSSQKRVAQQLLQAVSTTGGERPGDAREATGDASEGGSGKEGTGSVASGTGGRSLTAVIDEFARIALSDAEPQARRQDATEEIGRIAAAPGTPPEVRARAADAATSIAISDAPAEVRRTAEEIVAQIRSLAPEEVAPHIASAPLNPSFTGVILHHSGAPITAASYRGLVTLTSIGRFQTAERGWTRLSWHYAVAPDGSVWLGMPLFERAIHAASHSGANVSVLMILDGDRELPSPAQQRALALVLNGLSARMGLAPEAMFSERTGFHTDYPAPGTAGRSCPGRRLTKPLVLEWMREARA